MTGSQLVFDLNVIGKESGTNSKDQSEDEVKKTIALSN